MKGINILLLLSLVLATGCATVNVESAGSDIKEKPASVITVGATKRDEIVRTFGEPSKTVAEDGLEKLVYDFRKVETPTYIGGLVVYDAGKAVTIKRLEVVIKEGVVQSYRFESKNE